MSGLDWTIVVVCVVALSLFSIWTSRYMQGVADFLAANRTGGRYMMTLAQGMSATGAVSLIAYFEVHARAGFPPIWWGLMHLPVTVIIVLTGWVYYRFRQTRCLTMAQFFERRYSRPFRVYAGIITWACGVVNFGIFPAVAARFFVYFCGLPPTFSLAGVTIYTYIPIMIVTLGMALGYTCLGGQITVMITDCVQGIVCMGIFVVTGFYLLNAVGWVNITEALKTSPVNQSMLNPYDTSEVGDFNVWFYLIGIFGVFYGYMSWQGSQAYYASALNPHEQKMGQIISIWRQLPLNAMQVILPVAAVAFLVMPQFADRAAGAHAAMAQIVDQTGNETIVSQMKVPIALAHMLPTGLKGLFCSLMIFFLITTQDTYLHSWGSIFVQDVILPFRTRPFTPQQQLRLLRYSIGFVAVFAFFFSALFRQTEAIMFFMAITGAIVSGAGAVIVGGLYWSRGTSAGAWVAMSIGWVMAVGRIVLQQLEGRFAEVSERGAFLGMMDYVNSINSQVIWFWIMMACIAAYILVSLMTCRQPVNMDRVLRRGRYAEASDHIIVAEEPVSLWWRITGITREFSRWDRWLAGALIVWNGAWLALFLLGTLAYWGGFLPEGIWPDFWGFWVYLHLWLGVPLLVWLSIGGYRDIRDVFARLNIGSRDQGDDGRVEEQVWQDEPANSPPKGTGPAPDALSPGRGDLDSAS